MTRSAPGPTFPFSIHKPKGGFLFSCLVQHSTFQILNSRVVYRYVGLMDARKLIRLFEAESKKKKKALSLNSRGKAPEEVHMTKKRVNKSLLSSNNMTGAKIFLSSAAAGKKKPKAFFVRQTALRLLLELCLRLIRSRTRYVYWRFVLYACRG